jgi:hypothetical protein
VSDKKAAVKKTTILKDGSDPNATNGGKFGKDSL